MVKSPRTNTGDAGSTPLGRSHAHAVEQWGPQACAPQPLSPSSATREGTRREARAPQRESSARHSQRTAHTAAKAQHGEKNKKLKFLKSLKNSWGSSFRWVSLSQNIRNLCVCVCVDYNPMDCSLPGSSVPEILQARILAWVVIPFSRGSSWSRDRICISHGFSLQADSLPPSHWGSPT